MSIKYLTYLGWFWGFFLAVTIFIYSLYLAQFSSALGSRQLSVYHDIGRFDLYQIFWKSDILSENLVNFADFDGLNFSALDHRILHKNEPFIMGVMIDNHPDARPQQKGLSKASLVYEALAEGGITRYLAFFSYQILESVGPVRSARPYFIRFVQPLADAYAHAGGSPDALDLLSRVSLVNLEGLYYEEIGSYFYRNRKYFAPHNLYANLIEINDLINQKIKNTSEEKEPFFLFGSLDQDKQFSDATDIEIDFSDSAFKVKYEYSFEENYYIRYLGEKIHVDQLDQSLITPTNVVVMITSYRPYDDYGRLEMEVLGKGNALIFTDGKVIRGYWQRNEYKNFMKLYDESGKEVQLGSGQTWIEVVDSLLKVEF